jgi:DNA polymerase elongation subunit (family B)
MKQVLEQRQLGYKVTANSLYGGCGAKTSSFYEKDIAACTTATGRKMILLAKEFLEKEFNANIIYGDTDSIFCIFPNEVKKGKDRIIPSINMGIEASKKIKPLLKKPHDLEYEKTFWPFILLSKKRYVGNLYEFDDVNYKQKSMGIVLKRRDNAQIVKHIYGGIIDIILNKHDVQESVQFLQKNLDDLINEKIDIEQLIVTKSLRAEYVDPTRIAHKVLADRMRDRDPGNAPQINDRIPYVYIKINKKGALQGDRIEHPDFIKENKLKIDYEFYITNQVMKPVLQVYGIVADKLSNNNNNYDEMYKKLLLSFDERTAREKLIEIKENDAKKILFDSTLRKLNNSNNKQAEITNFFKVNNNDLNKISIKSKESLKPGDDLDIKILNTIRKKKNEKSIKDNKDSILKYYC